MVDVLPVLAYAGCADELFAASPKTATLNHLRVR